MSVFWVSRGKDEEYARLNLAPQKITFPIDAIREERPDKMMSRLSSRTASCGLAEQQRCKRADRSVMLEMRTRERYRIVLRLAVPRREGYTLESFRDAASVERLPTESRRRFHVGQSTGASGAS